jgi:hypothetical protein
MSTMSSGTQCGCDQSCSPDAAATSPVTMPIVWQRLVRRGETCPRCGSTQSAIERAVATLTEALRPLNIEPTLETIALERPSSSHPQSPTESGSLADRSRSGSTRTSPSPTVAPSAATATAAGDRWHNLRSHPRGHDRQGRTRRCIDAHQRLTGHQRSAARRATSPEPRPTRRHALVTASRTPSAEPSQNARRDRPGPGGTKRCRLTDRRSVRSICTYAGYERLRDRRLWALPTPASNSPRPLSPA